MGKKHKRRHRVVDPLAAEKERDKIKQSVLKVFEARLVSPNKGGALLVGPSASHAQTRSHVRKQCSSSVRGVDGAGDNDFESSSSSMSDGDGQGHSRTSQKRKRSRRSKSKKLEKQRSKDKSVSDIKSDKESSSIKKTLKQTHGAHQMVQTAKDVGRPASMITQNRLTRRLGLFNQGKKSATISREPRPVPEHILKKTEEDLRKIVEHSKEHDLPTAGHLKIGSSGPMCCLSSGGRDHIMTSTPVSVDHHRLSKALSNSTASMSSLNSDDGTEYIEKLSIYEVRDSVLSSLKPKEMFRGRNLFKETVDELYKLMKQNAPRSATPTPSSSKLMQQSSGSVKRSLLDQFQPNTASLENTVKEQITPVDSGHKQSLHHSVPSRSSSTAGSHPPSGSARRPPSASVRHQSSGTGSYQKRPHSCTSQHSQGSDTGAQPHQRSLSASQGNQRQGAMHLDYRQQQGREMDSYGCEWGLKASYNHSRSSSQRKSNIDPHHHNYSIRDPRLVHHQRSSTTYRDPGGRVEMFALDSDVKHITVDPRTNDIEIFPREKPPVKRNYSSGSVHMNSKPIISLHSGIQGVDFAVGSKLDGSEVFPACGLGTVDSEDADSIFKTDCDKSDFNPKVLLEQNDRKHLEARVQTVEIMDTVDELNADSLLKINDSALAVKQNQQRLIRNGLGNVPLGNRDDCVIDINELVSSRHGSQQSQQSMDSDTSSGHHYNRQNIPAAYQRHSVIVEDQGPEYMPRFHGNYYQDCLHSGLPWQHDQYQARNSMDILDYIDKEPGSTHHSHRRNAAFHSATPDSDGSPVWKARDDYLFPRKPIIDAPSPQQQLFPRRLY